MKDSHWGFKALVLVWIFNVWLMLLIVKERLTETNERLRQIVSLLAAKETKTNP